MQVSERASCKGVSHVGRLLLMCEGILPYLQITAYQRRLQDI